MYRNPRIMEERTGKYGTLSNGTCVTSLPG